MTNASTRGLVRDLAVYSLLRLGLVAVVAVVILGGGALISVEVPLLIALLFAVVIALPLSMVVFAPIRRRVNEQIAAIDEARRNQKEDLRARLAGRDGQPN
jgi:hypothetical protein